ncbi:DUF192 domain-containing protein [Anabaena sp. CS-542/02]|uniref:DUF192 domain-containing protein n=1 Tax=Anabaena sp. CS-542/02 TaxID=3021719 RepID=UPI00232A8B9F|nr:DUF192 domain-containing protein [Anabaena sp. CS-542/02]MDB9446971.1 DUF192 domain-containing protein [Anabaena sp. CS-542/02]
MMRWLIIVPMLLNVLLMGCSVGNTAKYTTSTASSQTKAPSGQMLPISAQAVLPNGSRIQLEVARTPEQQAKGLMYRPPLPDDQGMLFEFPDARPVRFWMKNVPVPLDMVFLQNGVVQYVQASAPPCPREPCPTYGPNDVPVDMVIELRSGRSAELNLRDGDVIKIEFLDTGNLGK